MSSSQIKIQLTKIKFRCLSSEGTVVPTNWVRNQTICKPSCNGGRLSEEDYQLICVMESSDATYIVNGITVYGIIILHNTLQSPFHQDQTVNYCMRWIFESIWQINDAG